jgi:hypothetical protein
MRPFPWLRYSGNMTHIVNKIFWKHGPLCERVILEVWPILWLRYSVLIAQTVNYIFCKTWPILWTRYSGYMTKTVNKIFWKYDQDCEQDIWETHATVWILIWKHYHYCNQDILEDLSTALARYYDILETLPSLWILYSKTMLTLWTRYSLILSYSVTTGKF